MPELDVSIQPPTRLRLMTTLTAVSEAEFATLRETLQLPPDLRRHRDPLTAAPSGQHPQPWCLVLTATQFAHDGVSDHADVAFHAVRVLAS